MSQVERESVETFHGPSNTLLSPQADNEQSINIFDEAIAPGKSQKSQIYTPPTPGLRPFAIFPYSPIRGLCEIDEKCFVVGGDYFAELSSSGLFGIPQPIANDLQPVSMVAGGTANNQVLIGSAGLGYVWDILLATLTNITAAGFPFPVRNVDFLDGYFMALQGAGSRRWNISALEDATLWDPLDVAERSEAADNLTWLKRYLKNVVLGGFRTSEIWGDVGDPLFPFAPQPNILLERGGQAPLAPVVIGDSLMWLEQNKDGNGRVIRMVGYNPVVVSTPAVELSLVREETPTDAVGWGYELNGHVFYVLRIPRSNITWVYDLSTDRWHQRATWNPVEGNWMTYRPQNHVLVFDRHLVGDSASGAIYEMSADFATEELVIP